MSSSKLFYRHKPLQSLFCTSISGGSDGWRRSISTTTTKTVLNNINVMFSMFVK